MSTAVIIAGQMRSFDQVWLNQYWTVYRHLPDPYFFISVAKDEDAIKADMITARFPRNRVFIETVTQPTIGEPKGKSDHGAYRPSAPPQGILRQLWALNRAWTFFEVMKPSGVIFDSFLRIRPDLHFHWFEWPRADSIYPRICYSPWWSRWGGICDRVAVLGAEAAPVYFQAFQKLDEMLKDGAPLHPESLMAEALKRGNVISETCLGAWFSTVRKDGSSIPPDPQVVDIVDYMIRA